MDSDDILNKFVDEQGNWKPIKPGTIYQCSDPEFVGVMPVRSEIEVLPADDCKKIKLGWTITEERYKIMNIFEKIIGFFYSAKCKKIEKMNTGISSSKTCNRTLGSETRLTEDNQHFESLNHLKKIAYQTSKNSGFHQEGEEIKFGNFLMNQVSEISELWESYRNSALDKPCDKSAKMIELFGEGLTQLEEEVADSFLRLLDLSETMGVDLAKSVRIKNLYNSTRPFRHGGKIA